MSDFDIEDAAGQEILTQTCAAIDRLDEITWCIAQAGGAMVKGQRGLKVNPLLKLEATLRVFVVRSLAKLGLEPSVMLELRYAAESASVTRTSTRMKTTRPDHAHQPTHEVTTAEGQAAGAGF